MEGKSHVGPFHSSSSSSTTTAKASSSSSSSFTSELFGSKESSSSSAGIFGSIFSPSSKVIGRGSLRSEAVERKQDFPSGAWTSSRHGVPDGIFEGNEGSNQNAPYRDINSIFSDQINSIFSDQRAHPCHLSSSIYYGGQDIYNHPPSTNSSSTDGTFKKDVTEDDSGSASRGNWWQGSLYY